MYSTDSRSSSRYKHRQTCRLSTFWKFIACILDISASWRQVVAVEQLPRGCYCCLGWCWKYFGAYFVQRYLFPYLGRCVSLQASYLTQLKCYARSFLGESFGLHGIHAIQEVDKRSVFGSEPNSQSSIYGVQWSIVPMFTSVSKYNLIWPVSSFVSFFPFLKQRTQRTQLLFPGHGKIPTLKPNIPSPFVADKWVFNLHLFTCRSNLCFF